MSTTRQTTMDPISIGLPCASFTLSLAVSKLRVRSEIRAFLVNGFTHQNPASLTVPEYFPNRVSTFASFGWTWRKPPSAIAVRM